MSWPNVSGRVMAASVSQEVQEGGADSASATSYIPMVQYEYAMNNRVRQGNKLAFQDKGFNSHKKVFVVADGFPAGSSGAVFYHPAYPMNAMLERQAHGNNISLIPGSVLVIASIAMHFSS